MKLYNEIAALQCKNADLFLELSNLKFESAKQAMRSADLRAERDDIQLRLQAIDHAYNEQQRSENKLILEQQETIRRQRQFIKTLYTSRKARKSKGSTSGQSKRESVVGAKSGDGDGQSQCSHRWIFLSGDLFVCKGCDTIWRRMKQHNKS
jgi:hypothetical protein